MAESVTDKRLAEIKAYCASASKIDEWEHMEHQRRNDLPDVVEALVEARDSLHTAVFLIGELAVDEDSPQTVTQERALGWLDRKFPKGSDGIRYAKRGA